MSTKHFLDMCRKFPFEDFNLENQGEYLFITIRTDQESNRFELIEPASEQQKNDIIQTLQKNRRLR